MRFPLTEKKLIRGAKEHIAAGLGSAADYVANYVYLFAPRDGVITTYYGIQGGNWLSITFDDGYVMKFAHLSRYVQWSGKVSEGQAIAITGNTGSITTGPHLHLEVYTPQGVRIDPEIYFTMTKFKLTYLSDTEDYPEAYVDSKLQEFSGGQLGLSFKFQHIPPVTAPPGIDLDQFQAMAIVDSQVLTDYHGVALGHYGNNLSPGFSTYTSQTGILMTQGYKPFPPSTALFEVGHQLIKYYNAHRETNPYIENFDNYSGGEEIVRKKVKDLIPYLAVFASTEETMTEKDVRSLQALEGYSDPGGITYWTGKPLSTYLAARLADKVKTIQAIQ